MYSVLVNPSLPQFVIIYVKDDTSDPLSIFLQQGNKRSKVRKLCKINKCEFISDIANSELIQAPNKTASLLSHQYFHTLRNLLDKHAPIHERKTPQHVNKGFINRKILAAKRHKHKLEW